MLKDLAQESDLTIKLPVQETFQETIQGEGYWAGTVVDFIRLYGCPVNCYFCDQEYADGGQHLPKTLISISDLIKELRSPRVVISGGEPTIHKHLPNLIKALLNNGKEVSLETAGTHWHNFDSLGLSKLWVTLSPKEHLNQNAKVDKHYWNRANEVKIVISKGDELNYYNRGDLLKKPWNYIYLQPEWEQREITIPKTLELLRQYPTAKLSLQTHKYIGIL